MDPRLFVEWARVDEHLRCVISARDERRRTGQYGQTFRMRSNGNPIFIVSRADLRTYTYLKQALAGETVDVLLDRRSGDRRQAQRPAMADRRHGDRRRRDVRTDLRTYGWALVSPAIR